MVPWPKHSLSGGKEERLPLPMRVAASRALQNERQRAVKFVCKDAEGIGLYDCVVTLKVVDSFSEMEQVQFLGSTIDRCSASTLYVQSRPGHMRGAQQRQERACRSSKFSLLVVLWQQPPRRRQKDLDYGTRWLKPSICHSR